jgi:hypothetical protein
MHYYVMFPVYSSVLLVPNGALSGEGNETDVSFLVLSCLSPSHDGLS